MTCFRIRREDKKNRLTAFVSIRRDSGYFWSIQCVLRTDYSAIKKSKNGTYIVEGWTMRVCLFENVWLSKNVESTEKVSKREIT